MEQEHPLVFGDGNATLTSGGPVAAPDPHDGMKRQTDAVRKILAALEPLPPEGRMRVIRAAAALFGVALP